MIRKFTQHANVEIAMQREEGRCLRFLIEMKFLCLCCPFCFDILVLCSLKALNRKNSLNAKEIQRKTDGGWLVSDPTRKHDDFCGLLSGVVHGGRLKPNWDTAVKYDMKSFETLWWWSQNCQNWIFELGKNLFTPWKQRSLIETPKHKPNRNKAPTWQGFLSTPRHQIHAHTKSSPPNSSLIFFQHDLPSRWAKTFAFPYLFRMLPLSRHHFVCFGAPNPLMHLRCKTHMVKESLKVSRNLLWLPETQASPFFVGSLWSTQPTWGMQHNKKTPPFLSWSFGVEANRHGSV